MIFEVVEVTISHFVRGKAGISFLLCPHRFYIILLDFLQSETFLTMKKLQWRYGKFLSVHRCELYIFSETFIAFFQNRLQLDVLEVPANITNFLL